MTSVTWDDWYLQTPDGVELYVREVGHGPSVAVVLHGGWGAEHSYLLDAFEGLDAQFRFVFYDQRGSLRSPCPSEKISLKSHMQDLELLRRQLGVEEFVVVGHSMGTFLANAYVAEHPDHVSGLILLGTVTPVSPLPEALLEAAKLHNEAFFARSSVPDEIARCELDGEHLSDKQATHKWRIAFAGANLYHVDRWASLKGGRVFYNGAAGDAASDSMPRTWDFRPTLGHLGRPVTAIQGEHDYALAPAVLAELLAPLDNAEVVVLEEAGHIAWIDQPERFRLELQRALKICGAHVGR